MVVLGTTMTVERVPARLLRRRRLLPHADQQHAAHHQSGADELLPAGIGEMVGRIGALRFGAYATVVAAICCVVQFLLTRPLSALMVQAKMRPPPISRVVASPVCSRSFTTEIEMPM